MQMNQRNTERGATNGPTAPANLLKTKLRHGNWLSLGAGLLATLLLLFALPALHAQTTAQISGIVTDNTGAVIPPAELDRLFQPFQQLGRERIRGSGAGGHGLGLAIAAAIVTAHGAALAAAARPGGGLDITVTFRPASAPAAGRD